MSTASVLEATEGPPPILDAEHYEIINGERVETPRMGVYECWVASILDHGLGPFASLNNLGRVSSEMMFILDRQRDVKRRPDLSFVSYERWPRTRRVPAGEAWDVAPDLAIEVVSPSNKASEMMAKVVDYFRAGTKLVWVIFPLEQLIQVWESPAACRVVSMGEDLEGGEVVPGFRIALADLFEGGEA